MGWYPVAVTLAVSIAVPIASGAVALVVSLPTGIVGDAENSK